MASHALVFTTLVIFNQLDLCWLSFWVRLHLTNMHALRIQILLFIFVYISSQAKMPRTFQHVRGTFQLGGHFTLLCNDQFETRTSPRATPGIWTFQFSCGKIPHPGAKNPFKNAAHQGWIQWSNAHLQSPLPPKVGYYMGWNIHFQHFF